MACGKLRARLLGQPAFCWRDEIIRPPTRKALALLCYLAARRKPATRKTLAHLLWGEDRRVNLRQEIKRLRGLPGGESWLSCKDAPAVSAESDLEAFEHAVGREDYAAAIRIWGLEEDEATFLQGLNALEIAEGFRLWLEEERERLGILIERALRCRALELEHEGDIEGALKLIRQLLARDELNESAHQAVMRLELARGNPQAALQQFERCRRVLLNEVGSEPIAETLALAGRIRQLALERHEVRRRHAERLARTLPSQATTFIGRVRELEEIRELLEEPGCRLLTLLGPGGIGKTRLAAEIAKRHATSFADGAYFASLASIASAEHVPGAVASALGFSFQGSDDPKARLLDHLRDKDMLLVLDNLEHLADGASLVQEMLTALPATGRILVTSRECLNLQGEWLYEVAGMDYPASADASAFGDFDAVRLFRHNARRVKPSFSLQGGDKPHVLRICRSLRGLPLAVELAATWLRLLSPKDIAAEIHRDLDLLEVVLHDLPERHHGLRAVFEHSWRLLSAKEQAVLCKLTVFRGGFSRQAAERVAGASLHVLLSLVGKSLLRQDAWGPFEAHPLVWQFAKEKAQATDLAAARKRHCRYYTRFLAEREVELRGAERKKALEALGQELENLRSAWAFAVERGRLSELAAALPSLACFYRERSSFGEGRELLARAIEALRLVASAKRASRDLLLGRLLVEYGFFCDRLGFHEEALVRLSESSALFRRHGAWQDMALPLLIMGHVGYSLGRFVEARENYQESLKVYERTEDQAGIGTARYRLGMVANILGDYEHAKEHLQASLEIHTALDDHGGKALCLFGLGLIANAEGEYVEAEGCFQDSLAIYEEMGNRSGRALNLFGLGYVAYSQGDYHNAKENYGASLELYQDIDERFGVALALANLGMVAHDLGDYKEAKKLSRKSLALCEELGFNALMPIALNTLGRVACSLGKDAEAERHFRDAFARARRLGTLPDALDTLTGMAEVLQCAGQPETAALLLGTILQHPAGKKSTKDVAERLLAEIEPHLGPERLRRALERSKALDLDAVAEVLEAGRPPTFQS